MTTFHTTEVEGLNVFYRQAGDPADPKLLLLGGFPSSSHPAPPISSSAARWIASPPPNAIAGGSCITRSTPTCARRPARCGQLDASWGNAWQTLASAPYNWLSNAALQQQIKTILTAGGHQLVGNFLARCGH